MASNVEKVSIWWRHHVKDDERAPFRCVSFMAEGAYVWRDGDGAGDPVIAV